MRYVYSLFKVIVYLAICVSVFACTASYKIQNIAGTTQVRLDSRQTVFVALPEDGHYEDKNYPGSSQSVAQAVAEAFSRHAANVVIASQRFSDDQNITAAQEVKAAYLVVPVITHWEHRATEWSGRPSVMSIRVAILDTKSRKQITAASINGRSRVISFTTTSPESLLHTPLKDYIDSLY